MRRKREDFLRGGPRSRCGRRAKGCPEGQGDHTGDHVDARLAQPDHRPLLKAKGVEIGMGRRRRRKGRAPPQLGGRLGRVYVADKGICHLCHMPVPADAPPNTDQAPTVDHLVPTTFGGTDDERNLRLAHRLCNNRRGAAPMWALPLGTFDNIWR